MEKQCYYEVLGVERSADVSTIKKSYRKIALECHPDRCPDDKEAEARFKEAAEAYEVLSNQEKRSIYDRYGHAGLQGGGFSPGFRSMDDIFSNFGDIFGDIFGMGDFFGRHGGRRRQRVRRGSDFRYDMELSLEEVMTGLEKEITVDDNAVCTECGGTGAEKGSSPETCMTCNGQGQVVQSQGFFSMASTCPTCRGSGTVIKNPCSECNGAGVVPEQRKLKVQVPAGVDTGMRLRLQGQGERLPEPGVPGDLYVFFRIEPHPEYERKGDHLLGKLHINFAEAVLGESATLEVIDGPVEITVPAGSQPGDIIRIAQRGVPNVDDGRRGDLFIQLILDVPHKLPRKAKKILKELRPFLSTKEHD